MSSVSSTMEKIQDTKAGPATYGQAPGRRHFLLRRLHSLMGLVFGGYVVVHLLVNSTGFWPQVYQANVDHIHSLEPMLPLIELVTIFIPLLIHALYGLYITKAGVKFNTTQYNYGGNVRYTLQRVCGIILLLFIGYHIATLHKWGLALFKPMTGGMEGPLKAYPMFDDHHAYLTTVNALKTPYETAALNWAVMIFYLLGVWSATFHFANGLWTSAIAWGLTVTATAQRRFGHFCCAMGIILTLIGTGAWVAFTVAGNPDYKDSIDSSKSEDVMDSALPATGKPTQDKDMEPEMIKEAPVVATSTAP